MLLLLLLLLLILLLLLFLMFLLPRFLSLSPPLSDYTFLCYNDLLLTHGPKGPETQGLRDLYPWVPESLGL